MRRHGRGTGASPRRSGAGEKDGEAAIDADANNPLAKTQAFNLHDYYVPTMSEAPDQTANTFWLRYAQPFGKWLVRASLPLSRVPAADGTTTSGLGDFNAFAAYLFDTKPGSELRRGAADHRPHRHGGRDGHREVAGRPRRRLLRRHVAGGPVGRARHLAGGLRRRRRPLGHERPRRAALLLRPARQGALREEHGGHGLQPRGRHYNVPVGLGIGQVVPTKSVVFNVFVEPQFTVLSHGARQPELQVFVGFNTQFLKK